MGNRVLSLGSTGKTGKRVAEYLQNLQISIRLWYRNGHPHFTWDDPNNRQEVFSGLIFSISLLNRI